MLLENMMSWCKEQLQLAFDTAVPAAVILIIGLLAIRIVMTLLTKLLDNTKLEKAAHSLIKSAVRVVLFVLLGLMLITIAIVKPFKESLRKYFYM